MTTETCPEEMGDDTSVRECQADIDETLYVERGMMASFAAPFIVLALIVVGYSFWG